MTMAAPPVRPTPLSLADGLGTLRGARRGNPSRPGLPPSSREAQAMSRAFWRGFWRGLGLPITWPIERLRAWARRKR